MYLPVVAVLLTPGGRPTLGSGDAGDAEAKTGRRAIALAVATTLCALSFGITPLMKPAAASVVQSTWRGTVEWD